MSQPDAPVPGIVVAHGRLAAEMLAAARSIGGGGEDVAALSNDGRSLGELTADVAAALADRGPGAVILVDAVGSSCMVAAMTAARGRPDVTVIAGVNLPLLLDFLQKRVRMAPAELVPHIVDRGRGGVKILAGEGV